MTFDNAFKRQWELFLLHVVKDEPFPLGSAGRREGRAAGGKGLESWRKRAWVDIPELG